MTKDLNKGISNISYNLLNLPQQVDILSPLAVATNKYSYSAGGVKLRVRKTYNSGIGEAPIEASVMFPEGGGSKPASYSTVTSTTDYVGNKIYENNALDRILVDGGYIKGGVYYFYETDHLGSNRLTVSQAGAASDRSDYYPYGMQMAHNDPNRGLAQLSDGSAKTSFKFSGKELDVMHGLNLYDFSARSHDPALGRFTTVDPMAEKKPWISPYVYCADNPIKFIDPDGRREWPINETYKGYKRTHSNNWGEYRSKPKPHTHVGADMNFKGAGNGDKGAPIVSTHDGYVSSVKTIESGDKNAGGTRVTITSEDATVSTTYMHLSGADVKTGAKISEGQQIGEMGSTGFGKADAYNSHLHYELRINGQNVNPVGADGNLIDPQKIITPIETATLPEVTITASKTPTPQLPVEEIKIPKTLPVPQQ